MVSQTLANLEGQIGVRLFDRAARLPVLTEAGRAPVIEAREVAGRMDAFKARAASLAGGLEPEVSIVVDVLFPMKVLTHAIGDFQAPFPRHHPAHPCRGPGRGAATRRGRPLRLRGDGLAARRARLELVRERLISLRMVQVAAAGHPLTALPGPLSPEDVAGHVQLVLTDRSHPDPGPRVRGVLGAPGDLADMRPSTRSCARPGLGRHALGPGGGRPRCRNPGRAARMRDAPTGGYAWMPMCAGHRADTPPGLGGRWLIERRLKDTAAEQVPVAERSAAIGI